jgi:tetratricopeptide (TPR) repeat protein
MLPAGVLWQRPSRTTIYPSAPRSGRFVAAMPRITGRHIDSPAAVGRRLSAARAEAGLSQRQLAHRVACSPAYLSRIEAGARIPSLQLLRAFAEELGVQEEYLARGSTDGIATAEPILAAEMAFRLGETDDAERRFGELLDTPSASARVQARAQAGLGQISFGRGEHREAIERFEAARSRWPEIAADPSVADTLGRAYALTAEFELAISVFERALGDAERMGDLMDTLRFLVLLANTLIDRGSFGRAEELLGRALSLAEGADDPLLRARLWWSQSRLHAHQNDSSRAAKYARLALDTLTLTEHIGYAGNAYQLLAHIELDRGRPEEALALFDAGYPLIEATGNRFDAALIRLERARALAELGRNEEAAAIAMELSGEFNDVSPTDAGRAYGLLARVYESLGDSERAIELYELAAETLPAADRYLFEVNSRLGELLRREGRVEQALDVFSRAVALKATPADSRRA